MGYKALVDANITLAFNAIRDLAVDCTLHKSSEKGFDFATAEVTGNSEPINIKGVVIDDDKKSSKTNVVERQFMFKTRGLGDINQYDQVDIPSDITPGTVERWHFGPRINNDGYTILAEIFREV